MGAVIEEEISCWTALRKLAPVLTIIRDKTTVAEANRAFEITPSEIETEGLAIHTIWEVHNLMSNNRHTHGGRSGTPSVSPTA